jgi:molecular chaperone HscB
MTPDPIPVRSSSILECRNCGAGAPVDEHFCPQCTRILALGRHGDYFSFLGLPRALTIDPQDLERRFRDLSRKFHPDYYYNAPPAERLASLERSSYLNDAYRALKNPITRIEHLLAIEGLPSAKSETGTAKVPPSLLEEVFALNEELDEIRALRQAQGAPSEKSGAERRGGGAPAAEWQARLERARQPIETKRIEHEAKLQELASQWDAGGGPDVLKALRDQFLERSYIHNLLAGIERELNS